MSRARRESACDLFLHHEGISSTSGPIAIATLQDFEVAMIYLSSHLKNMYDRDAFDDLQVDFQILL